MRHPAFLCATSVLASAVACRTLAAQMFLGFGGLEARAGIADAKTGGSSATFEVDLGYAFLPELRTTLGIDFFGSSIDREVSGERVGGSHSGGSVFTSWPASRSTRSAPIPTIRPRRTA